MTSTMDRIVSAVVIALLAVNHVPAAHGQRRGQYGAGVTQATEFDCPEEFGYYPHPSDCTQYYVCVFGGALLESCTGGLMYSHELQTCDWPRNVGCGADSAADSVTPTPARSAPPSPRAPVQQQQQQQQQQRSQATLSREQQQQERRQRVEQEELAKQQLYAEDLGPAEEVESDRQQRVYRGQPSSLGQVARDRDGLRHQPNTIQAPSTSRDKVSVISYATQPPPQYSGDPLLTRDLDVTFEHLDNHLLHSETYKRRKKRQTLLRRHATRRHLYSHPLPAPPPPPPDDTPPHYRLLFDPSAPTASPPPAYLRSGPDSRPATLNLSAFLNQRQPQPSAPAPQQQQQQQAARPAVKASYSHPVNEDLRPPPLRPADGNPDVHPMSAPYRTLPTDGDAAGFVPIPNPNATPRYPPVSLATLGALGGVTPSPATADAPATLNHIHFQRLDSPTAKPVGQGGSAQAAQAAQQLTSPSSQVLEVSTPGRQEAETSPSYINEHGQKLHGNYRDPVPPNAKINGKTPLPPIPWVDERATPAPIVNATASDPDEDHDEDDEDDEEDDDDRRNKLSTNESKKTKAHEDHEDDEDEDDDDDEFGPHSDKPNRRPNKNKNEESEKHIMISDFKITTDPSPDHHHDEEEPVTAAPQEATLARPKPSQHHANHKEEDHEEDDEDDDEDFKESDFKYHEPPKPPPKPVKKKVPAKSPSQPQPQPAPQPQPQPQPQPDRPAAHHDDVDLGFTPARPDDLNMDDDEDHEEQQQEGYRPPDGFFSDDFGQDFDNEDGAFGKLDFDYDKFIKEMDAEKGIDGKVASLAHSVDKAESVQNTHGQPREPARDPDDAFFRDTGDSSKYSAPAKYPSMGYTGIPFSWDADERKKTPGKGKETGMYYDKYQAHKSPFGTESHRDMRYQKEGARTEKTRPKAFFGSPFADPNFDFGHYVDTIAATASTTTHAPSSSHAPERAPSQENATKHADEDDEDEDEDDGDVNGEPTRRSDELGNTVQGAKHARPKHKHKAGGEPLAKNHRYEAPKAARANAKPAESAVPAPAAVKTPVQDYEDMVSEEDKRTPPKYPRSTERAVRSTTPLYYSTPHTTAYSAYPRQGPHLGEFAFEQPSSRNSLLYTPRPKVVPSFAQSVTKQRVVPQTTPAAVPSSSFSAYGPDSLQHKFRQELGELQDSFRRPLFTHPSNHRTEPPQHHAGPPAHTTRAAATRTAPRKAAVTPRPKDDGMKEYFDVLGYTDEFKVENVHLAPTEAYDDLNPLKHIYPDIKAHIGLADDEGAAAGPPRSTTSRTRTTPGRSRVRANNQYQVFEDIAESRHNNRTTAPPSSTPHPAPFTRPNNRSHPESFRPPPPPPSNHKVTFHELTQTHPKTRQRALAAQAAQQQAARTAASTSVASTTTASPPRQSNRLTTPRAKATTKTAIKAALASKALAAKAVKDSASRDATRDLTRTTPTPRRPDAGKKTHGYRPEPSAAPLQYSPQPPQPQPSPTTGRSVFAHPANASYQPNNYDQYYAVYDDDDQLYRDVDYGHYQNNQGNSPQPFSRGNGNKQDAQNVEIVNQQPQQQQQQPQQQQAPQRPQANNAYVSSSFNVQSQDVYSPTVSSQDYNDNYNAHVNVQYDVDDTFPQTKPSRGSVRGRGKATFTTASAPETGNRGTPSSVARGSRPTLKPSTSIVSKAQEFIDIYKFPPTRPESVYPTPTPDKSAAKCRKDVCLLPDCNCGGKDIPGDLAPEEVPQIVLLTFDDSVNDLNKGLYTDLFEKGRTNPNGCPIAATFYVSHEWTDYSQVQNLYSTGHEIASHSVSHSFGEQFSQKKWTKEVAGQREILSAYGGVKQEDIRGMRAPFLAVGGNKMFKMLYDSNFTYDSSMPVYENKPPSWPYTLDYKLFHDCMIPPCPTRSYPGVWEVPMVMWTDLNGGRCSMGDACSNPPTSDGVYKMLIKNFERHYTTNRAPFGLFYHAAWFTQPHHKEGFIAFLDTLVSMNDVWLVTNWQALQWVRDPTPISRLNNFQPFQCNYQDRPRRCNNPKVCNLWHKSGVRYMRTCQPCPDVYPWTGKSGVRNSRVDNDIGTE